MIPLRGRVSKNIFLYYSIRELALGELKRLNNKNLQINEEENKDKLKKQFIDNIFFAKNSSITYELSFKLFKEINIVADGNCLYRCISFYFYKDQKYHISIRNQVFNYIKENKANYYLYFEDKDDNNSRITKDILTL